MTTRPADYLWVVGALTLLGLAAATVPVLGEHYWFHLVLGRLIDAHGLIPDADVFAYSADPNAPFEVSSWLGNYCMFRLHDVGGQVLTALVRNICFLAMWGMLAAASLRLDAPPRPTAAAMLLAGLAFLAVNATPSPAMFTWPLLGAVVLMLVSPRTWLGACAAIIVSAAAALLWANLAEGALVVVLCCAFAAWKPPGRDRVRTVLRGGLFVPPAALLLSPYGFGAFTQLGDWRLWLSVALCGVVLALALLPAREHRRVISNARFAATALAAMLLVAALQPWSDAHRAIPHLVFGSVVRAEDPLRGFAPADTPVGAVELLRTWGSQPRVLVAPRHAGYVLYELQSVYAPEPIVFVQPPLDTEHKQALMRSLTADDQLLRGVLQQFAVEAVIADGFADLGAKLDTFEEWDRIGAWDGATLYARDRRAASETAAK